AIIAIIWLLRALHHRRQQPKAPTQQSTQTIEPPSLSSRLHEFDAQFAPFASNSAHPRELSDQPAFKQAVALLASPKVPLDTVMQYVQGVSWTLACARPAALPA